MKKSVIKCVQKKEGVHTMGKEEVMEEFIDRLLEFYRITINEDEEIRMRNQELMGIFEELGISRDKVQVILKTVKEETDGKTDL